MFNLKSSSSLVISFMCFLLLKLVLANSRSVFSSPGTFFQALNNREKRYVTYPAGTAIGLLVAIALPVEVPEENLYFSLNFEANYNLPDNITQYYNSDIARILHSITRRSTYDLLQHHLTRKGYDGEQCLLKLICETASYEIPASGLLEDLFQIIFRPSVSRNKELDQYLEAEMHGFTTGDCAQKYFGCDESVLEFFTIE